MGYVEGADRGQQMLFPEVLDDYVTADNRVRFPAHGARRKAIVEHPFGTMERGMDQGYFLLRGLVKVRAEFSFTVLAYNLRRVINIVGSPRLRAALA